MTFICEITACKAATGKAACRNIAHFGIARRRALGCGLAARASR